VNILHTIWQHSRALWQNQKWRRLFPIVTTLASLVLLLWGLLWGWHDLSRYEWQFNWLALGASSVVYMLSLTLSVTGWVTIMQAFQVKATWRQDAKFFLYSTLARRLPTVVPYLASRILLYEQINVPRRITSISMLWETILLVASGVVLFFVLLPLTPLLNTQTRLLPVLIVASMILPFIVRPSWLARLVNYGLRRMGRPPLETVLPPQRVALGLAIYGGVWVAGAIMLFLIIRAVFPLPWDALPMVMQTWVLSGLISYVFFFAPVRFGIADLSQAALLSLILPISAAIVVVLLIRLWIMTNELLWALIIYKL
jgi:hypothetical protein